MFLGRRAEREQLERFLASVRKGQSRALVVRGEPGVGKTALLEYAREHADGCRVERAAGVQAETRLAFAGLHQLCAPMLGRLPRLPAPQRAALGTAFGVRTGDAPDRFLVGLAVLNLLAEVAEERPLVCLVDDAHWLDRASSQVLTFVARRLRTGSVGLLFAVREPVADPELAALPQMAAGGLSDDDARALLRAALPAPLDAPVRDRIIAETGGNPTALLELPRGLTPAQIAGGFGLPDALPVSVRIERRFRRRLEGLPADTRQLLLVAATEPSGEAVPVLRAAERLGLGPAATAAAAASGLLEVGVRVRFPHPLVRATVHRAASPEQRRIVHAALAAATEDPDRRAWHRAHAASGPDETAAHALERSAGRAQARAGVAAGAAFLERAAELTPDPARRADRALAAAAGKRDAGAFEDALRLIGTTEAAPPDPLRAALVQRLRAQIAFHHPHHHQRGGKDAPELLLAAAARLEAFDVGLARETSFEALAAPTLRRAVDRFLALDAETEAGSRALWTAGDALAMLALDLGDEEAARVLATRQVARARATGALVQQQLALGLLAESHLLAGELAAARALLDEQEALARATGNAPLATAELGLTAWRGREESTAHLEAAVRDALARGEGRGLDAAEYAAAVLHNGLCRHDVALRHARRLFERDSVGYGALVAPELVESAVRTGDRALAARAVDRLSARAAVSGGDWARGIEAQGRALLAEGAAAENLFRDAVERLERTRVRVQVARGRLLYGEWLRRRRRRRDARDQLRAALGLFTSMGLEAYAKRAARELAATSEHARRRTIETSGYLTAQEATIARLARDGLMNPEIASRLFISPRTVQYHLHKVFAKLDIVSRTQLGTALPADADAGAGVVARR